jgi:hypothetical protein
MVKSNHDDERRKARRFQLGWDVAVKGTDQSGTSFDETGMLQNLSSFGAMLCLRRTVPVGATVEVRIKVPLKKNNWMKYVAEVVRVKDQSASTVIGIKFGTARPVFEEG